MNSKIAPQFTFPSHVYGETFLGHSSYDLKNIETSIELIRRGDVNGSSYSNTEFGWQSRCIPQGGAFENITQRICAEAYDFIKQLESFNFSKITMSNLWANINYKGDINWPHNHGGDLSGAYYIKVPENSGNLEFVRYSDRLTKLGSFFNKNYCKILKPQKDKLILFDSACLHLVTKNNNVEPRISLSFNLDIDKGSQ